LTTGLDEAIGIYGDAFEAIFGGISTALLILVLLAFIDWRIALVALAFAPLTAGYLWQSRAISGRAAPRLVRARAEGTSRFFEYVESVALLRTFGRTDGAARLAWALQELKRSGAGKSALVGVIGGLNEPAAGTVRIGGMELKDFSAADRARTVTLVSEDTELFAGTVAANIAAGRARARRRSGRLRARRTAMRSSRAGLPATIRRCVPERRTCRSANGNGLRSPGP
jgi:ABC-type multidrug transport system fused ATPase/permease subunit